MTFSRNERSQASKSWRTTSYLRAIRTAGGYAVIRVRPVPDADALELNITRAQPTDLLPILTAARRMFDLAADPARIAVALGGDPLLRPLIQRRPGLRIPGVWEPFECCVRAIVGKQIGASAARAAARTAGAVSRSTD